jgi:hypothetical protein
MFIYLNDGESLVDILEDNSDLRSAIVISPLLGTAMGYLEDYLDDGYEVVDAMQLTVPDFEAAIEQFGENIVELMARESTIEDELTISIDNFITNLEDGMTFFDALESDDFLRSVYMISTDLVDALTVL